MIANIDDNVGRLLAKLKEWGLERDTLVIFMNDNGGTAGVQVFNAGMRGAKVTPWLGGTRASSFWRWPGTLKPADVRPPRRPHRLLPDARRDRRREADRRSEDAGRGPQPGAAAAEPEGRVARPHALHARRPLAEGGERRRPQVRRLQRPQPALAPGLRRRRRQEAVAAVRREGRPRREDRRGRRAPRRGEEAGRRVRRVVGRRCSRTWSTRTPFGRR